MTVLREALCRFLVAKGVLMTYTRAIEDIYNGAKTQVRTMREDSKNFF